jgi:hypothetical protein
VSGRHEGEETQSPNKARREVRAGVDSKVAIGWRGDNRGGKGESPRRQVVFSRKTRGQASGGAVVGRLYCATPVTT